MPGYYLNIFLAPAAIAAPSPPAPLLEEDEEEPLDPLEPLEPEPLEPDPPEPEPLPPLYHDFTMASQEDEPPLDALRMRLPFSSRPSFIGRLFLRLSYWSAVTLPVM